MKLIDIMKRYNKCILKENAKLRSIYNTLIRECDGADGETDVSERDDQEENECDVSEHDDQEENECDGAGKKMSIEEFLGECDAEKNTDECDKCGDDSCKDGEKCGLKEGEETEDGEQIDEVNDNDLMTAEEFFGGVKENDQDKKDKTDEVNDDKEDETNEEEELISKKEFYANEDDTEKDVKDGENLDEEEEEEDLEEEEGEDEE